MSQSFEIETEFGSLLSTRPDGTVVHARPGAEGVTPVTASAFDGEISVWLLQAADGHAELSIEGRSAGRGRTLPLVAVAREEQMILRSSEDGLALHAMAALDDEPGAVALAQAGTGFRRGRDHDTGSRACISFDEKTAGSMLEAGRPEDLPVIAAMLRSLPIPAARSAWLRCSDPQIHDRLFPIMQERGAASFSPFVGYTAETMRPDIERYGWSVGERTYGRPRVIEAGRGKLAIGRYCSLADPTIVLGNHRAASASSYPFMDLWSEWPGTRVGLVDHVSGDVTIGSEVWIGVGVTILPGATIGDGAVIGAGAVVRGHIPPYGVCVGNPATPKRLRFDPAIVDRLLALRWWDWPEAVVSRYIPLLLDADIELFLSTAEREFRAPPTLPAGAADTLPRPAGLPRSWLGRISRGRSPFAGTTPRQAGGRGGP